MIWTKCSAQDCAEPSSQTDEKVVWENEFFSRSVRRFYYLHDPVPGGLPEETALFDAPTGFFTSRGAPIHARYALVDSSVEPIGRLVAADSRKGISLYRLRGPLRQATLVRGIYRDYWAGPRVTYLRRGCTGGTLTVTLQGDVALFKRPSLVVVRSHGAVVARTHVSPVGLRILRVPVSPVDGRCDAVFDVTPTKIPGAEDMRRLGVRFISVVYMRA